MIWECFVINKIKKEVKHLKIGRQTKMTVSLTAFYLVLT